MTLICDYCDRPAKWMSALATNEPLCTRCAREQYSPPWRESVRPIGPRDVALAGLADVTASLVTATATALTR